MKGKVEVLGRKSKNPKSKNANNCRTALLSDSGFDPLIQFPVVASLNLRKPEIIFSFIKKWL
jgi:hypothetical protein